MARRCKICGGEMTGAGKVRCKNPVTKRSRDLDVWRCKRCGHRVVQ